MGVCGRLEIQEFVSIIDNTSADIMLHYNKVLNFIYIPLKEFDEKKELVSILPQYRKGRDSIL